MQSHAQESCPSTGVDGTCRATCHQPRATADRGDGQRDHEFGAELAFITDAAATASGEGASKGRDGQQE